MGKGRSRNRRGAMLLVPLALGIMMMLAPLGGCGCAVKQALDQAALTKRGLEIMNEVNMMARDGFDVREARARWLEAVEAYTGGELVKASALLDEIEEMFPRLEKVAERIFYESAGGITVSGLLFKPPGEGPWPAVVVNHAGFGEGADFSDVAIVFRDQGYLALALDFRGSGESEGRHELAKGEVDDVINGIRYIKEKGLVDGDRVALYGQSHGASVSMIAAARYDGISAVVAEAGFSDALEGFRHISSSQDPAARELYNQALPMVGGSPEEVPEEYAVRSPLNYAGEMKAPVLIIHGAKDPLVPVEHATWMYEALKAAGKTVELKIYPEEAHCVNDPANRLETRQMMLDWFLRFGV